MPDNDDYRLAHPVYLDVPMMVSFLAYLEGGVITQAEETARESGARERALKARAGARFRLPWAVDVEAGAGGSAQRREEEALELRTARHHTAASLFNLLYQYLLEDAQVVELSTSEQLAALRSGSLVEFEGEYLGNPIEDVLAYLSMFYPYITAQQNMQRAAAEAALQDARRAKRSGDPAKRAAAPESVKELTEAIATIGMSSETDLGAQMMLRMAEDLQRVPVHDLLIRTDSGVQIVLTVSSEYFSNETNEFLRAGEFRVIGKVTRVLRGDSTINLTRRTVLGAAGPTVAQELIRSAQSEELQLEVADPIVTAPAVQVLPMAIFL